MTDKLKDIKAVTMVRNDIFLKKWVEYYGGQLGKENLYIFFDGKDQDVPDFCEGCHTILIDKIQGSVVELDRSRVEITSNLAAELFDKGADMVIGTDADEFLVVDPELKCTLREFLSGLPKRPCYSGLGVDVIQNPAIEQKADFDKPFLNQRHRGFLYSRYTKAVVITDKERWGSGYHRVKGRNYHIVPRLYLFHFGLVDVEKLLRISTNRDTENNGWKRHELKRKRTIEKINSLKAKSWQPTVKLVRIVQQICRPIFALNKPTTYGVKTVVEIPRRFEGII